MQDKNPLAHYSGELSEAVQESAAANVPASGAAALSEYLKTCEQHAIVPDVGGAFASAFAAGFNLATSQAAQPAMTAALFAARGALQHLKEGGKQTESLLNEAIAAIDSVAISEAAPAAVAVPDAVRDAEKLLRAEAARLERIYNGYGNKWYGFSNEKAAHIEHLRVADALAATPAAAPDTMRDIAIEELAQLGYTFDGDKMMPPDFVGELMHVVQAAPCRCREGTCETKSDRACRMTAEIATNATPAAAPVDKSPVLQCSMVDKTVNLQGTAAEPVVLPEPVGEVVLFGGTHKELSWLKGRLPEVGAKLFTEQQVRALLATATGLPAQAVETVQMPPVTPEQFSRDIAELTGEVQADARDADGEAFRTAARLGLTLRFYGNCAQSGAPGTPSVYEVTTGPDSAEAMRASIDRAAIAAAKGE